MVEVDICFTKSTKTGMLRVAFLVPGKEGAVHKRFPALRFGQAFIRPVNPGWKFGRKERSYHKVKKLISWICKMWELSQNLYSA